MLCLHENFGYANARQCCVLHTLAVPLVRTCPTYNNIGWQKINYHSLLKFSLILIVLAFMNLNMTAKLPYHLPVLRRMD